MKTKNILGILLFAIVTGLICVLLFYRLGSGPVLQTDEATHGVNAYEMLKEHSYLINTYKYEVDYFNTKPPFSLWCMMLSYKLLGSTPAAMRMPAAIAGLLAFLVIAFYLYKEVDIYSSVLFGLSYMAGASIYKYHGFRSGDMDSLYMLFFALAMLCLIKVKKSPYYLYLYGILNGLAFLTKSTHIAFILFIGVLSLHLIWEYISIKDIAISAFLCLAIILSWMIPRFMFDGVQFIKDEFVGEIANKVKVTTPVTDRFYMVKYLSHQVTWLIFIGLVIACIIVGIATKDLLSSKRLKEIYQKHWIIILWALVPSLIYCFVGSKNEWYVYPAYIGANVCSVYMVRYLACKITSYTKESKALLGKLAVLLLLFFFVAACGFSFTRVYKHILNCDKGGNNMINFRDDIAKTLETNPECIGKNAYILNGKPIYKPIDCWENDFVYYAETMADWKCIDGGAEAFLQDPDGILIMDKSLTDEYIGQVAGHVIICDYAFLMFSSDMY